MNVDNHAYVLLFYLFAALTIGSGLYVALTRNIVRAAFALALTFISTAVLYVFLRADFLAAAQLLIYGGGITVLLLFGVMLTHRVEGMELRLEPFRALPALVIAVGFLATMLAVTFRTHWDLGPLVESGGTSAAVGTAIMTDHLVPFETISVLLLVVLIGALYLARPGHEGEEGGS